MDSEHTETDFAAKMQADINEEFPLDDTPVDEAIADQEEVAEDDSDDADGDIEVEGDDDASDDGEEVAASDEGEAESTSDDDDIYAELLKDEPEAVKTDVADALATENETLKAQINELTTQIIQGQGLTPPDQNLMNPDHDSYDPDEYNRQFFKFREGQEKYNQAVQAQKEASQGQIKAYLDERDTELKTALPIWFDEKRGTQIQNKMREAVVATGITSEQFDHLPAKALVLIDEALRYRAGLARLEKAKTSKPVSKIVRKTSRKGPTKAAEAKSKLKTTGKETDFSAKWLAEVQG